jgi:hypothetical protein
MSDFALAVSVVVIVVAVVVAGIIGYIFGVLHTRDRHGIRDDA